MYVRNGMTVNPYTVGPETTVAETLELMREKQIRRIPVVKNNRLIGIITERKLLEVSPSSATSLSVFEINYLLAKTKIESVMSKDVVYVTPDTLLEEASLIMRDRDIGGLPVVEKDMLVGIITETDIFDSFIEIMGFRDQGVRIAIQIEDDRPGLLEEVAGVIAEFSLNISHIAIYRNELIVRVNTINIEIVQKCLCEKGYKIISVMQTNGAAK
jgi:acetoin utilization protein AcuB